MEKIVEISDYELERGKPLPDYAHSTVQSNLVLLLAQKYREAFSILPEMDLVLQNQKAVPDVSLYKPLKRTSWQEDVLFFTDPPLTTFDISTRGQIFSEMTDRIFKVYLPSGVKSSWLILPHLKLVLIVLPDESVLSFTSGLVRDPTNGIEIDCAKLFRNN